MSRPIARCVVAALLPVALLAGCAGDQTSTAPPPPPWSASPTLEVDEEEYAVRTVDGAEAFVYHWINVYNRALGSGKARDIKAVEALTAPSCAPCKLVVQQVRDLHGGPGMVDTTGWTWEPTKVTLTGEDKRSASVQGMLGISAVEVRRGKTQIERLPASRTLREFVLAWRKDRWIVTAAGKVGEAN